MFLKYAVFLMLISFPVLLMGQYPANSSYRIPAITEPCYSSGVFCLPVESIDSVQNCIGFEMALSYNIDKVRPSGLVTIGSSLIEPAYVSYSTVINENLGIIQLIVFLNAGAPDGTSFNGKGMLLCVEFSKLVTFNPTDTAFFYITSFTESYNTRTIDKTVAPGYYASFCNTLFNGLVVYWSDNSPLAYNKLFPSQYLKTSIMNCAENPTDTISTNLTGNFYYDISNGPDFKIIREIEPNIPVQTAINGYDGYLLQSLLTNKMDESNFNPNIYQFLAMDVNMDGRISAGDLSQISQRSVGRISEYRQAWNYNNNGSKRIYQPSKDWVFISLSEIISNKAYHKSSAFPADDGVGFSVSRVPVAQQCFVVPMEVYQNCPIVFFEKYFAVMLGDVNGNYKYLPPDGKLKNTTVNPVKN